MVNEQTSDGTSPPFLNIQSEPDYSDDASDDYLQSIPSNSSRSSVSDTNYTTTNTNNNTFFSNMFKRNMNNIKPESHAAPNLNKKNTHENKDTQNQNVHQLHVIHSESESSAESEINSHESFMSKNRDASLDRLRSGSSDNESMRLFRENVHLLEEQPISDGYEPEDNARQNTFNINDIDKKQLTVWRFSNIDNLDSFFITFYRYYLKKGLYSFLLEKVINMFILVFVLNVSLTMKFCIDYEKFASAVKLQDIWVDKCYKEMPFVIKLLKFMVYAFLTLKSFAIYKEFKTMQLMNNFYYYLLEIDDNELQIISWVEVLNRLVKFKDTNNLFNNNNVTFENIVSRIMRYDNYLIAMYSNDTLFRVAGFINILLTPFLIIYFTLLYLLKYFYNIKSIFNSREYNLENRYKLREYNELEHFFTKRLNLSVDIANEYLLQFPNNVTNLIYKFLAFVSGSLLAILTITTLVADSENFLSFEVTKNKSILFYISIIGALNTFTYNNIQQDKYKTYQPKMYSKELVKYTHFVPVAKDNKPLSNIDIRNQFNEVYSSKLINIIHEFASLLLTPYILWFVLPKRSKNIIAFMESITEKDNELGFICKFANYKPEEEDTKKSFYYMHKEDLSQQDDPEQKSSEINYNSPKVSSIDVKELKYDNKRRIKDKLLRQEQMNYKNHRNRDRTHNNGYNLNYNSIVNFKGDDDSDDDILESLQGDKMMRSFMQFKRVYHKDK
ncbi:hypothetical protein ACO0OL_002371 [Hanseniaspora opuntiae]